ncbi:hypothetical protein FHP25_08640 [Vineibacter terrae]|uniref:Uncharacterized protein n=1 Tax=Vineibacter terrae TaxID=2586908 RepID=A0A5C8PSA7_9HYPH|nr:hypothetical protein [Vineibacter terrae]TXL78248.1 hypothetical protein FHP25_08640 [Vineibacter terrae]
MRIDVSSDVDRIIRAYADLEERQLPFAKAKALTKTAQDAQREVRADLPNRFTLQQLGTERDPHQAGEEDGAHG